MTYRVVSWSEHLDLTVQTAHGEIVTLDVPSLLHAAGLLSKLTHTDDLSLRVNHTTGKYAGVEADVESGMYLSDCAEHSSVPAMRSARQVAHLRAVRLSLRKHERVSVALAQRIADIRVAVPLDALRPQKEEEHALAQRIADIPVAVPLDALRPQKEEGRAVE